MECRRAFFGYYYDNTDLEAIHAEEYAQIIHADFKALAPMGIAPKVDGRFSRYIAVSEIVARSFAELTGIRPEVCYNPYTAIKPRKLLRLISATRLTDEKGMKRMAALANALDAAGIRYEWTVYTASKLSINSPNVRAVPSRLDILDYIAAADYLVQLSDTEGFCYSIVEALSCGTPVIVTPLPVLDEIGVKDGINGFVLPFDMSDIPLDAIVKSLKCFKYTPPADHWGELLIPGVSTWAEEKLTGVTVEAVQRYKDLELDRIMEQGERQTVTRERAAKLEELGLGRIVY